MNLGMKERVRRLSGTDPIVKHSDDRGKNSEMF